MQNYKLEEEIKICPLRGKRSALNCSTIEEEEKRIIRY
jgi:hypothetical protein